MRLAARLLLLGAAGLALLYRLLVRGEVTLDVGLGRRVRPLGPTSIAVAAPRETVFDVIAEPYLGRATRTVAKKLEVLERGSDAVLAAHFTRLPRNRSATTVEAVRFERPARVSFRLVRGPVPHVLETFELNSTNTGTTLGYRGELGTDFWKLGQWWGDLVAKTWERTVENTLGDIRAEAERRARSAERKSGRLPSPP